MASKWVVTYFIKSQLPGKSQAVGFSAAGGPFFGEAVHPQQLSLAGDQTITISWGK